MFIVKVPGINGNGKTIGCERAGNALLEALKEIHSNEAGKLIDVKFLDLEEIHLDNSKIKEANELIYQNALETFESKSKTVFLGGDHSTSFSLGKAFLDYCNNSGEESCLIVFDAHSDCMQPKEKNMPTNEEWLRALIEKGFPAENVLLVGMRNCSSEELVFLNKNRIRMININQLMENIEDTCDTIMEFSNGKELYVSIDVSVVDSAFAPATVHSEIGGLTSRQLIYLIQRINKVRNLRVVDIVEINSEKDKQHNMITTKLGAKILGELL